MKWALILFAIINGQEKPLDKLYFPDKAGCEKVFEQVKQLSIYKNYNGHGGCRKI